MINQSFWIFRSNLRIFEYYHEYKTLSEFKEKCHDFYLLQGIWYLEQSIFDEVVVWRLTPPNISPFDIVFDVNNRKFVQKFVNSFKECFLYPKPRITFFRGGFPEYCELTKQNYKFFETSLYLGASKRVFPKYGGKYNKILVEDETNLSMNSEFDVVPFCKTANPNIFKPLNLKPLYDVCWPCNFAQLKHKGQEFVIQTIANSRYLRSLKFVHLGNKVDVAKKMTSKYNVNNITFVGEVDRISLNSYLNLSKVGLVASNENDGCPRISTEILCSCTPLVVRRKTRLFSNYKKLPGVFTFDDNSLEDVAKIAVENSSEIKRKKIIEELVFEDVCADNILFWI